MDAEKPRRRRITNPTAIAAIMAPPRRRPDRRKLFIWQGSFENWSKGWVNKNLWRVRHSIGSFEDGLQECGLVFARVVNLYAETVDNPAWMMSLFKVAVVNQWNLLAERDGRARKVFEGKAESIIELPTFNLGPLSVALAGASAELQIVIQYISEAPAEKLTWVFASVRPSAKRDVSADAERLAEARLRQICGLPPTSKPLAELRELCG